MDQNTNQQIDQKSCITTASAPSSANAATKKTFRIPVSTALFEDCLHRQPRNRQTTIP